MTVGIEIQIGKIRGPWLNMVVERIKKHYVMGIITAHDFPGLLITTHASEPKMLSGVFKLTPYAKEAAGGVKLIGIQAELFPKDFKRVYGAVRRWRFKLVVDKSGVGFFEIEGIAIVSDGYITTTQELMKFFDERPVVVEDLLIAGEIRERHNRDLTLTLPTVGEA